MPAQIPHHTPLPSSQTFPYPTSTTSFWRTRLSHLDSHRSTPDLPLTTDIAIIGAGLSGVSLAYHVLQSSSSHSITLLEARQLCSGATGRNGGHIKIAVPKYTDILSQQGVDAAREVANFHFAQIYAMKEVVDREGLDCDFLITRSFDVFRDKTAWQNAADEVEKLRDVGIDIVRREVQILEGEDCVEAVTGVKGANGARGVPAASLWPYKFVCGLMEKILDRVNLQTHTVVRKVSEKADKKGFFELVTDRGVVRARKVVFASNGYSAGLLEELEGIVVPWKGTASRVVRLPTKHYQQRTFTYNIMRKGGEVDYLNHRLDGSAVIGGAREVFADDQSSYLATVDDSTLIKEKQCRKYFEERMEEYYQDWADIGADVNQIWTGIMGYTPDKNPLIGRVPGREQQYIMAGFNGAGMLNVFLSSKGLTRMILDGTSYAKSGIPKIYEVTKERLDESRQNSKSA